MRRFLTCACRSREMFPPHRKSLNEQEEEQVQCDVLLFKNMAVMEGSLSKWTNVMKGWQYRWFVLDDNSGLLSYYTVSR